MTADEVMGLADKYVDYCEGHTAEEQESIREALRDAITALAAERDQALKNREAAYAIAQQYAEAIEALGAERDLAVKENTYLKSTMLSGKTQVFLDMEQDRDDWHSRCDAIAAERDLALKDRDAAFEMGQRYGEAGTKSIDAVVEERDKLEIDCASLINSVNNLERERDVLQARVMELEKAFNSLWERHGDLLSRHKA